MEAQGGFPDATKVLILDLSGVGYTDGQLLKIP